MKNYEKTDSTQNKKDKKRIRMKRFARIYFIMYLQLDVTLVFFSSAVGCDYLSLASVNKHSEQTQTHASFRLSSSFFLCPRHFFIVFLLFLLVGSASLLVNFHCAKTSVLFASFSLLNAYKLNLDNISCGFASPVCIALFNDVSKSKTKNYCNTAFGRTPQIYLLRLG